MQITITVSPVEMLEVLSGINGNINIPAPKKQPTNVEISISEAALLNGIKHRTSSDK